MQHVNTYIGKLNLRKACALFVLFVLGTFPYSAKSQTEATPEELVASVREKLETGDYEGSFQVIDEVLVKRSFQKPFSPSAWAEIVGLKAVAYSKQYDWQKAIKIGLDAYNMLYTVDPKEKSGYAYRTVNAEILYRLATFYAGRSRENDYTKAVKYAVMAREYFSKKSKSYFACVNDLALYYLMEGNLKEARSMARDAVKIGVDVYEEDRITLAGILWDKAVDMAEIEEYDMATTYSQACLSIMEASGTKNSVDYVRKVIKLAGYYFQQRDFVTELTTLQRAEPVAKELGEESLREYIDILRKLALAYNHRANEIKDDKDKKQQAEFTLDMAQYEQYENLSRELLIQTNRIDEIRQEQLPLISNSALEFFNSDKVEDAIKYESIACQLNERYGDKSGLAHSCSNLATFYAKLKDYDNCLRYGSQSVDLYDDIEENTLHKQLAYNNVANYMYQNNQAEDAIKYGLKAVRLLEVLGDTVSALYSKALGNVSVYYSKIGDLQQSNHYSVLSSRVKVASVAKENADMHAQAAEAINKARGRKNKKAARENAANLVDKEVEINNNTLTIEWNQTVAASNSMDATLIHAKYSSMLDMKRRLCLRNYPAMSKEERSKDWDMHKDKLDFATNIAYSYSNNDSIIMDAFDAIIAKHSRAAIIASPDSQNVLNTWKDLQKTLDDDEAIVYFFVTEVEGNSKPHSALLLRKQWSAPKSLAPLYNERNILDIDFFVPQEDGSNLHDFLRNLILTNKGQEIIRQDDRVGDFIWGSILSAIDAESLKTIRLHKDGYFNTLDPTILTLPGDKQINTLYKFKPLF